VTLRLDPLNWLHHRSSAYVVNPIRNKTTKFNICELISTRNDKLNCQNTWAKHAYSSIITFVFLSKLPLYKPRQFEEVEAPGILTQSAHEGGKVVSCTHRPPLPLRKVPGTHFCQRVSPPKATERAEELSQKNTSRTPSGIKPATFRLVAKFLNQLRYCVPRLYLKKG
jgi:hypothetical protein